MKAEALYRLGSTYSDFLNSYKDYDKAIFYLDELLTQYPESEFKDDAQQLKASIIKIKENLSKE